MYRSTYRSARRPGYPTSASHYPQDVPTAPANLAGMPMWLAGWDVNLALNVGIADNDPIGTWKNKGAGGATYDVTQGTAADKPLFKLSRINGRPGLLFDASDTLVGINPVAQSAARHIWVVLGVPAVLSGSYIAPRNGNGYVCTAGASSTQIESNNVDTACTIGAAPTAASHIIELSFDGVTANKPICRIDGVVQTVSNSAGVGVGNEGAVDVLRIGANYTEAIAEMLFYSAVQSAGNAATTRAYLTGFYGIAA